MQMEDVEANNHSLQILVKQGGNACYSCFTYPEIARQQRDVEEGGAREAIQNRNHGVKESQN